MKNCGRKSSGCYLPTLFWDQIMTDKVQPYHSSRQHCLIRKRCLLIARLNRLPDGDSNARFFLP